MENKCYLERLDVDMKLRGLSVNTQASYRMSVEKFLAFAECPVQDLDETTVRMYLIQLVREDKIATSTINTYSAGIRFFFAVTLTRTMNYLQIPRFKTVKKLPEILTREEIGLLFETCMNLKHKAMLILAYGSGMRVSEIAALRIRDIDSKAMRVFVNCGKEKKDRYTLLSHECLCVLREYWTVYHPKHPLGWLFLGQNKQSHILSDSVGSAFNGWFSKTGIQKDVSIHSLRHSFATHLLEDGVGLFQIKELLGHASISSTTVYLHLANTTARVKSPADTYFYG